MRGARRCKLTQAIGDAMLEQLRRGAFRSEACAAAGVAPATFHAWERRARAGEEPFRAFMADVEVAEAVARLALQRSIVAAAHGNAARPAGDWRASAHLLEALAFATFAPVALCSDAPDLEARWSAARVRAVFASRT